MKAILVTFGSYGDVQPMIGLGLEFQRRGISPVVLTNGHFASAVGSAGIDFVEVTEAEQYNAITLDKDLWHPTRGFFLVVQAWLRLLEPVYEAISAQNVPGETVLVSTAVTFGARVAQEHLGIPLATVHLQPAMFRSLYETPHLPRMPPPEWQPRFVKRFLYWLADQLLDRAIAPRLNAFRSRFGLPAARRILQEWSSSPQLIVGLFPDWFAAPQPDWPTQSMLAGFPLYDGDDGRPLPSELLAFLEAGDPPVVFTPGTAMRQGERFFETAIRSCEILKRRAILLTRYREQVPERLPDFARHFDYLPFGRLLPRCAAIVHHGGAGTTAQGLAAGIPQLIMPMAFDQPDNAARSVRLGVADLVRRRTFHPQAVARRLGRLLGDPAVGTRCREWAIQCRDPRRFDAAFDAIFRLVHDRPPKVH